ncbi:MAG: DUF4374 domain-containing protein [Rikenellaceae bacterium]
MNKFTKFAAIAALVAASAACQKDTTPSTGSEEITKDASGVYYANRILYTVHNPLNASGAYSREFSAENYIGTYDLTEQIPGAGEGITYVGWAENDSYVYASIVTTGVNKWSIENSGIDYSEVADYDFTGYYSDVTRSIGSGTGLSLTPDNAWIVVYDKSNTNYFNQTPVKILHTNKMDHALGRYPSNPLNTVHVAADGNVYVFSAGVNRRYTQTEYDLYFDSNKTTLAGETRAVKQGTKKSSVMRINSSNEWDGSFFFDGFETTLGSTFSSVWYMGGTKFLLRVLNDSVADDVYTSSHKATADARFAIYDASNNSVAYVTGLPTVATIDTGSKAISAPYIDTDNTIAYVAIASTDHTDGFPAIYSINSSGVATKGASVEAPYVVSLGRLTNGATTKSIVMMTDASASYVYTGTVSSFTSGAYKIDGTGFDNSYLVQSTNAGTAISYISTKYLCQVTDKGGNDPAPVDIYTIDESGKIAKTYESQGQKYEVWGVWGETFIISAPQSDGYNYVTLDKNGDVI